MDLSARMEEMREYAGVCSKLEQNISLTMEDNERLSNELSDQRDFTDKMQQQKLKMVQHMKQYEQRLKEYEQELGNRDELYENHEKLNLELMKTKNAFEEVNDKKSRYEN